MVDLSVMNGLDLSCRVYKNNRQAKRLGTEGVIQGHIYIYIYIYIYTIPGSDAFYFDRSLFD